MPDERRQFRILFRDFLRRIVDLELLSSRGDAGKILAQLTAMLAAFSFTFLVVTIGKYAGSAPDRELMAAAQTETEFLFATTMAVAGLFAVLVWNNVLPDRRDCAILGVLPVRLRTIFLARALAICTALGTAVLAINLFTGLCYPFLLLPPGASAGSALRSMAAYWLAMAAIGVFVCCTLLTVQGMSALLLSRRMFLRLSSWIQLAAFVMILLGYFLRPPLSVTAVGGLRASWVPSAWFYALFQQWSGTAPPVLRPLAARALWCVLVAGGAAAVAFALAFRRSMRRVMEQPDIAPPDRSRYRAGFGRFLANRVFPRPLDRAVVLFTARTFARSRQHRLLLAVFCGIGTAIALVYARDLLYGYSGGLLDSLGTNGAASRHWNRMNVPFLAGSLALLCVAIAGARAAFSMPIALGANWVFRITAVHSPAAYFSAVRKALFALSAIPVWTASALIFFTIWPAQQALEHVLVIVVTGVLLTEISLHRFRKIPFACSYLPGKSNLHVRFGIYAVLFLLVTDRGAAIEYWAMQHWLGFLVLFTLLTSAALWARRRTSEFANARGNRIQFEDAPPAEVFALDLRMDGEWSSDEAYVNALDPYYGRKLAGKYSRPKAPAMGLSLIADPPQTFPPTPRASIRVGCEQLLRDIGHGARVFRNSPTFSATAVFLIALGLGVNLTVYSIIHSVLAKPAPAVRGDGLVTFGLIINGRLAEGGPQNSYPNYLDLAAQTKTMSALTASAAAPFLTLTLPDGTYEIRGEMVSANYFETLGVAMARGRTFTIEESRGAGGLTAVIAYHLWQNQFHGAQNIVGQSIMVNGHQATVVGVAAEGFHGEGLVPHLEIGLPLEAFSRVRGTEAQLYDRTSRGVSIIGRLAPHVPFSQARAEFAELSERLQAAHPGEIQGWAVAPAQYSATAFGPNSGPQAQRLMAGINLIALLALLVVCGNVASLTLGRCAVREREIAIRLSIGASRPRVIRVLAAEALILSLTGCFAAWILTSWVTRAIGSLVPPLESGHQPHLYLTPDGTVFAYGMTLAVLSALVFTLAPAIGAWRLQILPQLKAGEPSRVRGKSRFANTLVIAQLALCFVLLTAGSLAFQSIFYIDTSDLYFTKDHLLLANVNTTGAATTNEENIALLERIRHGLNAIRGVSSVSYATAAPPHDHGWMDMPVRASGSNYSVLTDGTVAGPDYIAALGVPRLIGRDISSADTAGAHASAVVNQKLAAALWPGKSALGKTLALGEEEQLIEVVGVVPNGAFSGVAKDGSFAGIGKAERPNFLFLAEHRDRSAPGKRTFHIRYAGDLKRIVPAVRAAVREIDGRVPVFSVRIMAEEFSEFTSPIRIIATLIGIFAASALLLSCVGLYAAIAFDTARRTREFGIRTALGATPWQVLRAVLKQGLLLTGAGFGVGLILTNAMAPAASGLLFGVNPTDVVTYLAVIVFLGIVSLAACYIPARRASRVDPMLALRQD